MILTSGTKPALIVTIEKETVKALLIKSEYGRAWLPKRSIKVEGKVIELQLIDEPLDPPQLVLWEGVDFVLGMLSVKHDENRDAYVEWIYRANPDARVHYDPVYLFQYSPSLPFVGMSDEQMVGILEYDTDTEFRHLVNRALSSSYPVRGATVFEQTSDHGFKITAFPPQEGEYADRAVLDLFINMWWLRYESAEAHAKALANATTPQLVNHAVILVTVLCSTYGISVEEANRLVEKYKDKDHWSRIKFVLGAG